MQGRPRTWYKKMRFVIEIDGIARAAFTTCSELSGEVENSEHMEGGDPVPFNAPGKAAFPELTLARGVCNDFDLYNWFKSTLDAAAGTGLAEPDLYRDLDIVQLDNDGKTLERYRVYETYCRKYVAGDWDNKSSDARMEQVILKFRYFERHPAQ